MAELRLQDGKYVFKGSYDERDIPKGARFRWDGVTKQWWTDDKRRAAALARYAVGPAREQLLAALEATVTAMAASRATDADVDIPRPEGLDYLPYQRAGIAYAMERDHCLIADEMGLGKTIQAIGIANADGARKILVICPASLRLNWHREFNKWKINDLSIGVANGDYFPEGYDVVVINYDIIERHRPAIDAVEWDLLICDESHYLKTPKAQRTAVVLGGDITRAVKGKK